MDTPEHLRTTKVNKQISDVSTRNIEWVGKLGGILDRRSVWRTLLPRRGSEAGAPCATVLRTAPAQLADVPLERHRGLSKKQGST